MREAVAALDILPVSAEGRIKKVTLSYGVASVTPTLQLSPLNLIEAADAQLYRAKQQGRDRIEAAAA
jgi:PleD family two-component response regulator